MNADRKRPEESMARLGDLARRALEAQASAARQSVELGRAALSSDVDALAAGRAWWEAVGRESTRYWKEAGALGIDVAGQLVTLGTSGMSRVLGDTQAALRPRPAATGRRGTATVGTPAGDDRPTEPGGAPEDVPAVARFDSDGVRRAAIRLRGPAGGEASGSVVLANTHNRARRVDLVPGTLTPAPTGDDGTSPALTVTPDAVTIPAGEEGTVEVVVTLPAGSVSPGDRLTGSVEVTGGVEAVVEVVVEVL